MQKISPGTHYEAILSDRHKTPLRRDQYWLRQCPGAIRQQATTWANVSLDPCRHTAPTGHSKLIDLRIVLDKTDV